MGHKRRKVENHCYSVRSETYFIFCQQSVPCKTLCPCTNVLQRWSALLLLRKVIRDFDSFFLYSHFRRRFCDVIFLQVASVRAGCFDVPVFLTILNTSSVASPKTWEGPKNWGWEMFAFRRITLFCLRYHFSKYKITICSENLGGNGSLAPPGYTSAQY